MSAETAPLEAHFADLDQQHEASRAGDVGVPGHRGPALRRHRHRVPRATRIVYPHDFEATAGRLNVLIGGLNTVVLLASSLTMALAVHAAQQGRAAGRSCCCSR